MKKKADEQIKTPELQNPAGEWSSQQKTEIAASLKTLLSVKGIGDPALVWLITSQLQQVMFCGSPSDPHINVQSILALMQGMKAENTVQLLLATQMLAVHSGAIFYAYRASKTTGEESDRNLLKGTALMKIFSEQAEVMTKVKNKAAQKVVVEHQYVAGTPRSFNPSVAMRRSQEPTAMDKVSKQVVHGRLTPKGQAVAPSAKRTKTGKIAEIA